MALPDEGGWIDWKDYLEKVVVPSGADQLSSGIPQPSGPEKEGLETPAPAMVTPWGKEGKPAGAWLTEAIQAAAQGMMSPFVSAGAGTQSPAFGAFGGQGGFGGTGVKAPSGPSFGNFGSNFTGVKAPSAPPAQVGGGAVSPQVQDWYDKYNASLVSAPGGGWMQPPSKLPVVPDITGVTVPGGEKPISEANFLLGPKPKPNWYGGDQTSFTNNLLNQLNAPNALEYPWEHWQWVKLHEGEPGYRNNNGTILLPGGAHVEYIDKNHLNLVYSSPFMDAFKSPSTFSSGGGRGSQSPYAQAASKVLGMVQSSPFLPQGANAQQIAQNILSQMVNQQAKPKYDNGKLVERGSMLLPGKITGLGDGYLWELINDLIREIRQPWLEFSHGVARPRFSGGAGAPSARVPSFGGR